MEKIKFRHVMISTIIAFMLLSLGFLIATQTKGVWHNPVVSISDNELKLQHQMDKHCAPTPIRVFQCGQRWDACLCDTMLVEE